MSPRSISPTRALGVGAFALALVLSVLGVPVTSAQGTTVFADRIDGSLPVDAPFDAAWDDARVAEVVLSGQPVTPPKLLEPTVASIRVRSLVDDTRIAILLEWDDVTRDDSVLAVESFSDAAAIQFALGSGTSICMGQQAGGLNLWHWKADWAADLAGRRDVGDVHPGMPDDVEFPAAGTDDAFAVDGTRAGRAAGNLRSAATLVSSVEDLNALGFGSLTSQSVAGQNVHGASEFRDGRWRVVMSRELAPDDPNDAALRPGSAAATVAFAIWDGSRGDRDGQKSVSTWLALTFERAPVSLFDIWPFLFMLALALGLSGVVVWYGLRQPDAGLGWPNGRPDGGGDP